MLDAGTVRIVGGLLFLAPFAAAAMYGRSVLAPRGATVAARDPARGTEALWLGTIGVAQLWTLGVVLMPRAFYAWPLFGDFPGSAGIQMLGLLVWFLAGGLPGWAFRIPGRLMPGALRVMEGHPPAPRRPAARVRRLAVCPRSDTRHPAD